VADKIHAIQGRTKSGAVNARLECSRQHRLGGDAITLAS